MIPIPGEPFDAIFDVGGNIGEWAERAHYRWPDAKLFSFEPLEQLAAANVIRAHGRWTVYPVAISEAPDDLTMHYCVNQHSASTLQPAGAVRRERFGIVDRYENVTVDARPLDAYLPLVEGCERLLVKVDVEGHEGAVLLGSGSTLRKATTVIVEVQNDPDIFRGSPAPSDVDRLLGRAGLCFAGLADVFLAPGGEVLQFDGMWSREPASYYYNR